MLFPIPDPTFWTDPGPLPIRRLYRRLWRWAPVPFFPVQQAWVDQWRAHLLRLEQDAEAYQMWLDQQIEEEISYQQYMERGEEIAEMLPYELHLMGLSYRRTVQDRKSERPYEKVDYCHVESWYFDDYAFYFWIATWYPLRPNGVTINKFFGGDRSRGGGYGGDQDHPGRNGSNPIADTLTGAFGAACSIEFNSPDHKERPGLWVVVEHRAGRGNVPRRISFQQCMQSMPKTADPLSFMMGAGRNKAMYISDLGEVYNLGIGGSVGGGKSNMINNILCTFISRNSPADLRLFLVDFKRVELAFYKGIVHLGGDVRYVRKRSFDEEGKEKEGRIRTVKDDYEPKKGETIGDPIGQKIVTTGHELVTLLDYLLAEIERRTLMLVGGRVKKISTWNKRYPHKKLAYWVLVIDEFADVMLQPRFKNKVEPRLIRTIQLGRAMGVHCIIATQTPKSSVITGLIQNNITSWIAFRCGNGHASALMLDGKWDAAALPAIQGRCIVRQGDQMREVQTPEITDLTVNTIVKAAKTGKVDQKIIQRQWSIPPDRVFEYALKELEGACTERDLYNYFRNEGVALHEIRDLLREFQVAGDDKDFLEPEIELGDVEYYLAPSRGGRTPRELVEVGQFKAEFDEKWAPILERLARRTSSVEKSAKHPDTDNSEISKAEEVSEPDNDLETEDESFDEDYYLEDLEEEPAEELPADLPDWLR